MVRIFAGQIPFLLFKNSARALKETEVKQKLKIVSNILDSSVWCWRENAGINGATPLPSAVEW